MPAPPPFRLLPPRSWPPALYLAIWSAVGPFFIGAAINFGVAAAMYAGTTDPVTTWWFPNTLEGDTAVTIVLTSIVTWIVGGQLATANLRAGALLVRERTPSNTRWDRAVRWAVGPGWDFAGEIGKARRGRRRPDGAGRAELAAVEDASAQTAVEDGGPGRLTDADADADADAIADRASGDSKAARAGRALRRPRGLARFLAASALRWAAFCLAEFVLCFPPLALVLWLGLEPAFAARDPGTGRPAFGRFPFPAVYKAVAGGLVAAACGVGVDGMAWARRGYTLWEEGGD